MKTSDSFSLRRAFAYGRTFNPYIRYMLIIYPAVSLVYSLSCIMFNDSGLGFILIGLLGTVENLMISLSPLCFAFGTDTATDTLVPARQDEKAFFMITWSLVIIPALVFLFGTPLFAAVHFFPNFVSNNEIMKAWTIFGSSTTVLYSYISLEIPAAICLLAIIVSRKHRILMGLVWSLVTWFFMGILSFAVGFLISIAGKCSSLHSFISKATSAKSEFLDDELEAFSFLNIYLNLASVIYVITLIVLIVIIFHRIKIRQA